MFNIIHTGITMIALQRTGVKMNKAIADNVEETEAHFLYFNHGNLNSVSSTKFPMWYALTGA